jgi:hypothetical protein
MVRRFIFSRSDIFKSQWPTKDVGPEGTDLQDPHQRKAPSASIKPLITSKAQMI